jgi:ABC-type Fe3+/spermidine/putrescine transport system ATPase subunit
MAEKCLELKDIRKSFSKDEVVLKEISLSIDKGEFITLLGSSGCGKTTTLRIIAGLETPDSGKVYLEGKDVTALAPEARDVNTVFQNYALFPHMTVADNIGYGLKLKKIPKAEIKKRVSEMLELVQLPGYEKRKPSELSGGQRQRVAIARSLVNNPKVLLLDEPLGALDLQLRRAMQLELKRLQKKLGITFIYITHDQEEAMVLGDQIAIMDQGKLVQIGKPEEVYLHPQNDFARDFLGISNRFTDIHGNTICCRPEELEFAAEGSVKGIVRQEEFLGFYRQYYVETMNHEHIIVRTDRNIKVEESKEVQLRVK